MGDIEKISTGYDRGVDYKEMKEKFIKDYDKLNDAIANLDTADRWYDSKKRKAFSRSIYTLIVMIQLANGSRISEACCAFKLFVEKGTEEKVIVKIAKSKSIKYKNGKKYITPTRFRKMQFPKWIEMKHSDQLQEYVNDMDNLPKRSLNHMLRNYDCNTHSLRYAFINYMLYDQKREMTAVAKFVGHTDIDQLIRYTQNKESDKLFDIDI